MTDRVCVLGHRGMVGSAIVRALKKAGYADILCVDRREVDLSRAADVKAYMFQARPTHIYLAAARVGGIQDNIDNPLSFLLENLAIQDAVLGAAAAVSSVKKLLFLGSSCMYPRDCPQPMKESDLYMGPPEPTNRAYAVAKRTGLEMCLAYRQQFGCNFITAMPCNQYGPNDHYDSRAHVVPALIRRFAEARLAGAPTVTVWGSGNARREFMHVDDLADACLFLMDRYDSGEPINIGTGMDVTISELAHTIAWMVDGGAVPAFDPSAPDGMPRKMVDVSRLTALGWTAKIGFEDGLRRTVAEYVEAHDQLR